MRFWLEGLLLTVWAKLIHNSVRNQPGKNQFSIQIKPTVQVPQKDQQATKNIKYNHAKKD